MVMRFFIASALALSITIGGANAQHAEHRGGKRSASLAISAAFAPSGELWIVGLDGQRKLFVQASPDEGRSWSAPRALPIGADTPAADAEARPKLAFGPKGHVVITYTQPLAKPYTGVIRMLRSSDGGRTFSAPFTVHRDRQVITHRFDAVAFDKLGTLHTCGSTSATPRLAALPGTRATAAQRSTAMSRPTRDRPSGPT
jgi:hypothetical protein